MPATAPPIALPAMAAVAAAPAVAKTASLGKSSRI